MSNISNHTRFDEDLTEVKLVNSEVTNNTLIPPPSSNSFYEKITRLVMGHSARLTPGSNISSNVGLNEQHNEKRNSHNIPSNLQPQLITKRACRAPASRRFAHPCSCSQLNNNQKSHQAHNSTNSLPPAAYTNPLYLYDSATKKCLPTSRVRDMLLKECRSNVASPYPIQHQHYHGHPCVYDDLVCDLRRNRCICKPTLHLYYESNANNTAFGCVPLALAVNPSERAPCKSGYIYNVISNDCQRIFDVNELPPTQMTGVSATQFSFVTIVLIWMLLFILIATAKLRKCRNPNAYGNSPTIERRHHRGGSYRPQGHGGATTWLHPFMAAVNGHHQQQGSNSERHSQSVDDPGNFSDTDLFLSNGDRRLNELFPDGAFRSSQQSINNPPPKFEEIYPNCPSERHIDVQPPANEDLPTYDEAMKLQVADTCVNDQKG